MGRVLSTGEKTMLSNFYSSALGVTIDYDKVRIYDRAHNPAQEEGIVMAVPNTINPFSSTTGIYYKKDSDGTNHDWYSDDYSLEPTVVIPPTISPADVELGWDRKHNIIHELWHVKKDQEMNDLEYMIDVGGDAKEGNYNYEEIFGTNGTPFHELSNEQQAEFIADYYLMINGQADEIDLNKGKFGSVDSHTLQEFEDVINNIDWDLSYEPKTKQVNDSENPHLGGRAQSGDEEDDLGSRPNDIREGQGDAENSSSPLVLDLNGSGSIELLSRDASHAYFSLDNEASFAEHTGWIDKSSGDAFLVWDINQNGKIDNINELFGNEEEQGFIELADLDTNFDNYISYLDENFSDLQLWVDANGDGNSEEEELHDLSTYSIAAISLTNTRVNDIVEGNLITNIGFFTYSDGTTGLIADVWFDYNNMNTIYDQDYLVDARVFDLPSLRGYGDVADLHIAMSLDNGTGGLLEMVESLSVLDLEGWLTKDFSTLTGELDAIMYQWAGVENIDPASRAYFGSVNADARKIHYIEEMTGDDFFFLAGWFKGPNPPAAAGADLEQTFFEDQMAIAARLFLQGAGVNLFSPTDASEPVIYELVADEFFNVGALNQTTIDDLELLAQDVNVDALELWTNVLMMVTGVRGDFESLTTADKNTLDAAIQASDVTLDLVTVNNYLNGYNPGQTVPSTSGDDTLFGTTGDDLINGADGNDLIYGGAGNDRLEGSFDDDTLYGEAGDDWLRDSHGSNEFYGGTGGDVLSGGSQRDIYYFNVGDGDDAIEEGNTLDTSIIDEIVFGAGITLSDLTFVRIDNKALGIGISQSAGGGSISVAGHFEDSGNEAIELIRFDGGATFDPNSLSYTLLGTDESEFLDGVENDAVEDDIIFGNGGNDRIWGHYGSDEIHGGDGDDTIYAAAETSGLEVRETVAHTLNGDAGWDHITGAWGVDDITGGTGNDTLMGLHGTDHYYFDYGDGDDVIEENGLASELDKIHLGTGITQAMLSYSLDSAGYDLTITIDNGDGGSITIDQQFAADDGTDTVEQLILSDSTVIDLQYQDLEWSGSDGGEILYGRRGITGGNDTIRGLGGDDFLYGEDGNDFLFGGGGDDFLRGDTGDDHLDGGIGNNTLRGGTGTDVADYSDSIAPVTLNRETGIATHGQYTDTIIDVEEFIGTDQDDTFIGHDDFTDIQGGNGSDTLDYTIGNASTRDKVIDLTAGTASAPAWGLNDTFTSIENVVTDGGVDTVTGSSSDNFSSTSAGADSIDGLDGDDILIGGAGNDDLDGGNGTDRAHFSGNYADYTITDHTTHYTVADNVGSDGTDTIVGVEIFSFADQAYDVATATLTYHPTANDDVFSTNQDAPFTGLLWADNGNGTDTDPDSDPRSYDVDTMSAGGARVLSDSNGWFLYEARPGFYGTDKFEYVLTDGNGGRSVGTVTVNVAQDTSTAPTDGRVFLYDTSMPGTYLYDSQYINLDDYLKKTHAISFETGNDITSTQVLYEQGGSLRGLNFVLENGTLYAAVWNLTEENWGFKEVATDIGEMEANTAYTAIIVMDGDLPADGHAYLYKNGELESSVGGVGTGVGMLYAHDNNIGIGRVQESTRIHDVNYSNAAIFDGEVSKLVHYNKALSGTEIDQLSAYLAKDWLPGHFTRPTLTEDNRSIYLIDGVNDSSLPNDGDINTGLHLQKTHSIAFETAADITTTQVLYEQGGQYRGLNLYIQNGTLYAAVWEQSTENWGHVEVSTSIAANTKYTVTFEIDAVAPSNGTAVLYLNGIEVDSNTGVGELMQQWGDIGVGQTNGDTCIGRLQIRPR